MQSFLEFFLIRLPYDQKETSQKFEKIYSQREISDSPGSFGYKKTKRINKSTLQKKL